VEIRWVIQAVVAGNPESMSRADRCQFSSYGCQEISVVCLFYCTVRVVFPLTPFRVAVIVAVPVAALLAEPELLTTATAVFDEAHVTPTRDCVLPSLKLPVAVNCCDAPKGMLGLAGKTVIELNVAPVTVSAVVLVTDPNVAVIVDCPLVKPETIPV
jgi:hypothetical protein